MGSHLRSAVLLIFFRTEYFYFQNQFMLFVLMQIDMTQFLDLTRQVLHKSIFRGSELRKQKSR